MLLNTEQVARLYAAGSVSIPSFPDPGHITADSTAYMIAGQEPAAVALQIVHYPSPANKNTYVVPLSEVTALYLPEGLTIGAAPLWLHVEELRSTPTKLNQLAAGRPGTVFAKEEAGVFITTESAKTAGEIASYSQNCL